jgi:hypothetical protein
MARCVECLSFLCRICGCGGGGGGGEGAQLLHSRVACWNIDSITKKYHIQNNYWYTHYMYARSVDALCDK